MKIHGPILFVILHVGYSLAFAAAAHTGARQRRLRTVSQLHCLTRNPKSPLAWKQEPLSFFVTIPFPSRVVWGAIVRLSFYRRLRPSPPK